jgi:cardiolipin synthase A/B
MPQPTRAGPQSGETSSRVSRMSRVPWRVGGVLVAAMALAGCVAMTPMGAGAVSTRAAPGDRGEAARSASAAPAARPVVARSTSSSLALITEPDAGGSGPFLRLIASARHHVDMTMYELADGRIETGLAAAAKRGVSVRVLLNGGYYREREQTNRAVYAYLATHGVSVRYTPSSFALTHQKTLTIDDRLSAIMTLNLTSVYYSNTRDFAVLDAQPADVAAIEAVFGADWHDRPIVPSLGVGDLVWSPGAQAEMVHLISSARRSLEVENEEMADTTITTALCSTARRGVQVRLVMSYESEWRAAFTELEGCGVQVRVYHGEHPIYIHAKLILVDGRAAFVGSENFSRGSLDANRELGIVTTAPSVIHSLAGTFATDFSGAPGFVSNQRPG